MTKLNGHGSRSGAVPVSGLVPVNKGQDRSQSMIVGRLSKPTSRVIRELDFDDLESEMRKRDWYNLVAACQDVNGKYTLFFSLKDEYRRREDPVHEQNQNHPGDR